MNSLRISVRRASSVFAALALVLTTALPGIASAAQLTERSIALTNANAGATGVNYDINFTAYADAGAVVVEFCDNSPLIGTECEVPSGFNINTGTTVGGGFTKNAATTANKLVVTGSIDVSTEDEITVPVTGVANPTAAGPLYARVLTFDLEAGATGYTDETPGTYIDAGGVAIGIAQKIDVSAAVLESLIFCVTGGQAPGANCDTSSTSAPTLVLGENNGGVISLDAQNVSTGNLYTQLSTNAAGGAIVSLKSNTLGCGGLMRDGEPDPAKGCGIAPAGTSTFTAGAAKFGVKTATAAGVGVGATGQLRPFNNGGSPVYNNSGYALGFASNNSTGVTSPYGDPFLDTADAPVSNMGMTLEFGATAANNTPAGNYKAELSLIATGKF